MRNAIKKVVTLLTCITALGSSIRPIYAEKDFDIVVYVSVDGSENADGTIEKPFGTLEEARDAVRSKRKESKENLSAKVILRGGIYEIDKSFRLTKEDSGTAEKPTVYTSYPGEDVRLTGAKKINHKVEPEEKIVERLPEEARNKVLAFDLKKDNLDGLMKFEQMYYSVPKKAAADVLWDGKYCNVARWPNSGYAEVGTVLYSGFKLFQTGGEGRAHTRNDDVGVIFKSDSPNVEKWINAKDDAWLYGFWYNGWADDSLKIKNIMGNRVFTETSASFGVRRGGQYYIFNLPEELDSPGEWYVNNKSGTIYIYPLTEYDEHTSVKVTKLNEPIVDFQDVSYFTFERVIIESGMNNGVEINNCRNVHIAGCNIRQFSRYAVNIKNSENCGVLSSEIEQIGSTGIYIDSGDRSTLKSMGCYAVNNNVHDFGRVERAYYPGIEMRGVGNYMAYNKIHDAPHMALRAEGNNNIIEFNEIYDVVRETKDAGAFYTCRDQLAFGNIMRYNYYHDIYGGKGDSAGTAVGFYVDDVGCAWTCYGNVFNRVDHPILIGGGSNNKIINNLIVNKPEETTKYSVSLDRRDSWEHVMSYATATLSFANYKNEIWQKYYPEAYNIAETLANDGVVLPRNNIFKNNVIYNHAAFDIAEIAQELGTVKDNLITNEDIGFVEEDDGDIYLKKTSFIYELVPGFEKIPFEKIGLYNDQYRKDAD